MNVAGVLPVAQPSRDGRPAVPLWWRELAALVFQPCALLGGHNAPGTAAEVIGTVDYLVSQPEGWGWHGTLTHPGAIRALREAGELPRSAEFRAPPGAPTDRSDISTSTWPHPVVPSGIVLAVAVLQPFEVGAYRGSVMWIASESGPGAPPVP